MRSQEEIRQSLAATVRLVRDRRAASRSALAGRLGISPTTAGLYADSLIKLGYLRETGLEKGASGRPKRRLETVPGSGWFAGIEFHAERLRAVAVDFSGRRRCGTKLPIPDGTDAETLLGLATGAVEAVREGQPGPLLGIGFGCPGIVDPASGVGVAYAFLPGWREVPVAERLGAANGAPVTVVNNLRAIAIAERCFGGDPDLRDYVVLGPRSGFGVAVVQDGRLMQGAHCSAGEVGYWPWPAGADGTRLHDRLSSPVVWRRLAGKGPRARLPQDLHEALAGFASAEGGAWSEVVADMAKVVAMLRWLLDPAVFILHGPLTALGPRFCIEVEAAATAMGPTSPMPPPALRPTSLDDEAGALGAASLALETWVPGDSS